jgi:hypothetical protein
MRTGLYNTVTRYFNSPVFDSLTNSFILIEGVASTPFSSNCIGIIRSFAWPKYVCVLPDEFSISGINMKIADTLPMAYSHKGNFFFHSINIGFWETIYFGRMIIYMDQDYLFVSAIGLGDSSKVRTFDDVVQYSRVFLTPVLYDPVIARCYGTSPLVLSMKEPYKANMVGVSPAPCLGDTLYPIPGTSISRSNDMSKSFYYTYISPGSYLARVDADTLIGRVSKYFGVVIFPSQYSGVLVSRVEIQPPFTSANSLVEATDASIGNVVSNVLDMGDGKIFYNVSKQSTTYSVTGVKEVTLTVSDN